MADQLTVPLEDLQVPTTTVSPRATSVTVPVDQLAAQPITVPTTDLGPPHELGTGRTPGLPPLRWGNLGPSTEPPVDTTPAGQHWWEPVLGAQQFVKGAKAFVGQIPAHVQQSLDMVRKLQAPGSVKPSDEDLNAVSDMLEGAFEAAGKPAVVLGATTNPVGTGVGLALSATAAKGAHAAAKAAGASDAQARLSGNVAGALAAGVSTHQIIEAAKSGGRTLTLASKLSGSGFGPGDVPGFRANPVIEEALPTARETPPALEEFVRSPEQQAFLSRVREDHPEWTLEQRSDALDRELARPGSYAEAEIVDHAKRAEQQSFDAERARFTAERVPPAQTPIEVSVQQLEPTAETPAPERPATPEGSTEAEQGRLTELTTRIASARGQGRTDVQAENELRDLRDAIETRTGKPLDIGPVTKQEPLVKEKPAEVSTAGTTFSSPDVTAPVTLPSGATIVPVDQISEQPAGTPATNGPTVAENAPSDTKKALEEAVSTEKPAQGTAELPPGVTPTDIPIELAQRAHAGTSFVPDTRAKQEQDGYVEHMRNTWQQLAARVDKIEDQDRAAALHRQAVAAFEQYRQGYVSRATALLRRRSGLMSTMIVGPSKFPTARQNKKSDAYQRALTEFIEWDKKARVRMREGVFPSEPTSISADRSDATQQLQAKIDKAVTLQETMKAVNAIVRKKGLSDAEKVAQITEATGITTGTATKLLEPDFLKRVGFPDYELTNNAANIRRMQARIAAITTERGRPEGSATFDGGTVEENARNNRVQVVFDAKPDEAMRKKLKAHGFKWAPSEGAWQRQRGPNARAAVKAIFGVDLAAPPTITEAGHGEDSTPEAPTGRLESDRDLELHAAPEKRPESEAERRARREQRKKDRQRERAVARRDAQRAEAAQLDRLARLGVDQGYPGTFDEARAQLADRLAGIKDYLAERAASGRNGLVLLRAIARLGGFSIGREEGGVHARAAGLTGQAGELRWLKEFTDPGRPDTIRGVRGVFHESGGSMLDRIFEGLSQDPEGRFGHIETMNDVIPAVREAATGKTDSEDAIGELKDYLQSSGWDLGTAPLTEEERADIAPVLEQADHEQAAGPTEEAELAGPEAGDATFNPEELEAKTVDVNELGEAQPRLPGAETARQVGKAETHFRAPTQASDETFNLEPIVTEEAAAREKQAAEPGLFGDDEEKPKFSRREETDAPPFYSALTRAAYQLKQEKGTPQQMAAMLEKAPGVKKEELLFSGVLNWLREYSARAEGAPNGIARHADRLSDETRRPAVVTKAEIVDYLRANELQVSEVVLGQDPRTPRQDAEQFALESAVEHARALAFGRGPNGETRQGAGEGLIHPAIVADVARAATHWAAGDATSGERLAGYGLSDEHLAALKAYGEASNRLDAFVKSIPVGRLPKYAQYTLAGGEDYRELLLTVPTNKLDEEDRQRIQALTAQDANLRREQTDARAERRRALEEQARYGLARALSNRINEIDEELQQVAQEIEGIRAGAKRVPTQVVEQDGVEPETHWRISFEGEQSGDGLAGSVMAWRVTGWGERHQDFPEDRLGQRGRAFRGAFQNEARNFETAEAAIAWVKAQQARVLWKIAAQRSRPHFTAGHFAEFAPNVVAHVRFKTRIDNQGRRVLFIEEVQSDWHQKGRREGYADDRKKQLLEAADETRKRAWLNAQLQLATVDDLGFDNPRAMLGAIRGDVEKGQSIQEALDNYDWTNGVEAREAVRAYLQAVDAHNALKLAADRGFTGVPDAPFKTSWPELVLKRMIRYAAEQGFDGVAWTTGAQQNERYPSLRTKVDVVTWTDWPAAGEGMGVLSAHHGGDSVFERQIPRADLADYIGKEPADRLLAQTPDQQTGIRAIHGQDLEVGGQGMRGFYDRMLPSMAAKLVKPFGATVARTTFRGDTSDEAGVVLEDTDQGVSIVKLPNGLYQVMTGEPHDDPQDWTYQGQQYSSIENAVAYATSHFGIEDTDNGGAFHLNLKPMTELSSFTTSFVAMTPQMKEAALAGLPLFARDASGPIGARVPADVLRAARQQQQMLERTYRALRSAPVGEQDVTYFDAGSRYTRPELQAVLESEAVGTLADVLMPVVDVVAKHVLGTEATGIERTGFVFDDRVLGVFIPKPYALRKAGESRKATILLNPFDAMAAADGSPLLAADKMYATAVHEVLHWFIGADGPAFEAKLAQLLTDLGPDVALEVTGHIQEAYADPNDLNEFKPELADLLSTYQASRRRRPRRADALSTAGSRSERRADDTERAEVPARELRQNREGAPGVELTATVLPGGKEFVEQDVVPALKEAARLFTEAATQLRHATAPATVGAGVHMAGTLRAMQAKEAQDNGRMVDAAEAFKRAWDRILRAPDGKTRATEFIDAIETGRIEHLEPALRPAAEHMRRELDRLRVEVQKVGKLNEFIENYFPHIWKFPKADAAWVRRKLAGLMGRRPFEGSKAFLKQRSHATFKEGLKALQPKGIEPVSWNPVDQYMLKAREMRRYIVARQAIEDASAMGMWKAFRGIRKPPEGWTRIDGPLGTIYGPPEIPVQEAFDKDLLEGLETFATGLGVTLTRAVNIGQGGGVRNPWGLAYSDKAIKTKAAGPEGVLMHEIGHILDERYGLWQRIVNPAPRETYIAKKGKKAGVPVQRAVKQPKEQVKVRATIRKELAALADLRYENQPVGPGYKQYVRKQEEKMANLVHAFLWSPERAKEVAPNSYWALFNTIKEHDELAPLRDLQKQRSLKLGVRTHMVDVGGFPEVGFYAMPDDAARIFNNYLSQGLAGRSAVFDGYRWLANTMVSGQLLLAGTFHLTFTGLNALFSEGALMLQEMVRAAQKKDWSYVESAAKRAGTLAVTMPIGAAAGYAVGGPLGLLWATGYPLAIGKFIKGWRGKRAWQTQTADGKFFTSEVRQMIEGGFRPTWDEIYDNGSFGNMMRALRQGNYPGALLRTLPAMIDATMRPVMGWAVPAMKTAAYLDAAAFELQRLGEEVKNVEEAEKVLATLPKGRARKILAKVAPERMAIINALERQRANNLAVIREALNRVQASMDNRFGEVVYANWFWKRWQKDLLHVLFRAPGWQAGTYKELLGGPIAQAKILAKLATGASGKGGGASGGKGVGAGSGGGTSSGQGQEPASTSTTEDVLAGSMAYVFVMLAMTSILNGLTHYLSGNGRPHGKDWFYPKGPDGVRRTPATYLRTLLSAGRHPIDTIGSISNPLNTVLYRLMVTNQTWEGELIRQPGDPVLDQAWDALTLALREGAQPFLVQNITRGQGTLESLMGVGRAPAEVSRSDAENYLHSVMPSTPRTHEEQTRLELRRKLREAIGGKKPDEAAAAVREGSFSRATVRTAARSAAESPLVRSFKSATLTQGIRAYELATPDERRQLRPLLEQKYGRLIKTEPADKKAGIIQSFKAARGLPMSSPGGER